MVTVELLRAIDTLLPGADERSQHLRTLVRLLADAGGRLSAVSLKVALGNAFVTAMVAVCGWDGLRWSGIGRGAVAFLAPWVRKAVGLPVTREELLADLESDRDDEDEPSAYHRPFLADGLNRANAAAREQVRGMPCAPPRRDPLADVRAAHAKIRAAQADQRAALADLRAALARCKNASPADPLAGIRAALANCRNISTPREALEYTFPERFRLAD